jgi:hypothetical protein
VRTAAIAAVLALAVLAACGGDPEPATFEWTPVSGMACADGSATGVALSRGSGDVLVFLNGGGACWGDGPCDASTPRRFDRSDFELARGLLLPGTILDRELPGNPFAGWTMVFVPYCTGDVHAGDRDGVDHGGVLWDHRGRRNLQAALELVATTLPTPPRAVLAGSSAGGFGALLGYDVLRGHWPEEGGTTAALLDDSGPTFVGTAISSSLRDAWWDAWNLTSTVSPRCPDCRDDLSAVWTALSAAHPSDRFALLSSTWDATMRGFFGGLTGDEYATPLGALALQLDALPHARTFRVTGTAHPLLLRPSAHATGDTTLLEWLSGFAAGDPGWASVGP